MRKMKLLHESIRERLTALRQEKAGVEAELDDMFLAFGLGSGRALRAASRHYTESECIGIFLAEFEPHLHVEEDMSDESREALRWRVENAVVSWYRLHNSYEVLAQTHPMVLADVKSDRFRRALTDAKNWKL